MLHLDGAAIRPVLRWDALIAAMEQALAAFSSGRVLQPVRNMLTIEEGRRYLGIMPAVAEDAMGLKLVSFYPGNAGTGIPTHMAVILLFRPDTGEPLAVMDGAADHRDAHRRGIGGGDQMPCRARCPGPGAPRQRRAGEGPSRGAVERPRL